MNKELNQIITHINQRSESFEVDRNSVEKIDTSGYFSDLYEVISSEENLILLVQHDPSAEQKRQNKPEKIRVVSQFLRKQTDLPIPKILDSGTYQGMFYSLQAKVEGSVSGQRRLEEGELTDKFDYSVIDEVHECFYRLHNITFEQAGFLIPENESLQGTYSSWYQFLHSESLRWLKQIYKSDNLTLLSNKEYQKEKELLRRNLASRSEILKSIESNHLVHGDLANPTNIIVKNGAVNGIIDFEFALSGDPVWEFSHTLDYPMHDYFARTDLNSRCLDERRSLYSCLWSLFAVYLNVKNPDLAETLWALYQNRKDILSE